MYIKSNRRKHFISKACRRRSVSVIRVQLSHPYKSTEIIRVLHSLNIILKLICLLFHKTAIVSSSESNLLLIKWFPISWPVRWNQGGWGCWPLPGKCCSHSWSDVDQEFYYWPWSCMLFSELTFIPAAFSKEEWYLVTLFGYLQSDQYHLLSEDNRLQRVRSPREPLAWFAPRIRSREILKRAGDKRHPCLTSTEFVKIPCMFLKDDIYLNYIMFGSTDISRLGPVGWKFAAPNWDPVGSQLVPRQAILQASFAICLGFFFRSWAWSCWRGWGDYCPIVRTGTNVPFLSKVLLDSLCG